MQYVEILHSEGKNIIKKFSLLQKQISDFFRLLHDDAKMNVKGGKQKGEMDYPQNDQPSRYFNIKYFYENRDAKFTRPAINLPFFS